MRILPAPLDAIDVPEYFAASMLGGWNGCVAKLALASQRVGITYEPLPTGPAAAKGMLAHRVLERWIKEEHSDDPVTAFATEYERLRYELQRDPARAKFADLAEVLGTAEWSGFRAWVLRRCHGNARRAGSRRSVNLPAGAAKGIITGAEVPLASNALRLRGRADRISRLDDNRYEIRDFKSGAVIGEDGEIKEEIALQLQAYGLMFLDANPKAEVVLVVDTGTELDVAFDYQARDHARAKLEALVAMLPAAGLRSMGALAKPGPDCLGCRGRHVCQAYLCQAPEWWLTYPKNCDRIANDTWGTVTAVNSGAAEIDVTLTDAAGRRVCIDRLDRRQDIQAPVLGERLWFFGLEGPGPSRDFHGQRYHPRVFHELPRDRRERRAWSLQCFAAGAYQDCSS